MASRKSSASRNKSAARRSAPSRSTPKPAPRAPAAPAKGPRASGSGKPAARSTVSGPARLPANAELTEAAVAKLAGTAALAASIPYNANKAAEYGEASRTAAEGQVVEPADTRITASTLTEANPSPKTGDAAPLVGFNPTVGPLSRVRVDSAHQPLTTNQGVPIADNQSSLKAGLRGPALLE